MSIEDIYEAFAGDDEILYYFDPLSNAKNIGEVAKIVYDKIVEYESLYKCIFVKNEYGYIFYAKPVFGKKMLVSFCVKKKLRTPEGLSLFWEAIKQQLGKHFKCYLYTHNTRGINWLIKCGMKVKKQDELTTLLTL